MADGDLYHMPRADMAWMNMNMLCENWLDARAALPARARICCVYMLGLGRRHAATGNERATILIASSRAW